MWLTTVALMERVHLEVWWQQQQKKARVVKDEDSLRWTRWTLVANQKVALMERVHLEV